MIAIGDHDSFDEWALKPGNGILVLMNMGVCVWPFAWHRGSHMTSADMPGRVCQQLCFIPILVTEHRRSALKVC